MWAFKVVGAALLWTSVASIDEICGVWNVKMMHGFENKRVTENVMWTEQNTASLFECAARCGQHDLAVTCGYNPRTLECVAYSARFTDPSAVAYVDNSKYRMYSLNPGCSRYGTTFTEHTGRYVFDYDDVQLFSITEDECKARCVSETRFVCKTAEYLRVISVCNLSSVDWMDIPVTAKRTSSDNNLHARHCDI
ncbi:uncharacterized protein [Haliotis asinina]|uniref:uncharacterized protein n=1 Tax=Haliotis asinina TaxID=109174 RepID=UPI00353226E7